MPSTALQVAWHLGLGQDFQGRPVPILDLPPTCHGYQNACVCAGCLKRAKLAQARRAVASDLEDGGVRMLMESNRGLHAA